MDADLVVVARAGPVGLAVGVLAATAGLDVLVADPRADPLGRADIDKACGEGLLPVGLRRLQALGIDPPGRPLAGIRYLSAAGGPGADARFRAGPGRGVRRTELQRALAMRAADVRARVLRAAVTGFAAEPAGVRVRLRGDGGTEVCCRWLVGADGLHSSVRRVAGLGDAAGVQRDSGAGAVRGIAVAGSPPGARYGLRRHVATSPWTDFVEVHWARHGEAYVIRWPTTWSGWRCWVADPPGSWAAAFAQFPGLAERLGAAAFGPVRGAGPLRQVARCRVAGRVLLVGDAAGISTP